MKIVGKRQKLIFLAGVIATVMMLWPSALALAEYLADPTAPSNPEVPATGGGKATTPDDPKRDQDKDGFPDSEDTYPDHPYYWGPGDAADPYPYSDPPPISRRKREWEETRMPDRNLPFTNPLQKEIPFISQGMPWDPSSGVTKEEYEQEEEEWRRPLRPRPLEKTKNKK